MRAPEFLKYPAISRISVSTPRYFRGFLRNWADMEYSARIKPFGFLVSANVARFGHPAGVNVRAFHLLAPFTANPKDWAYQLWTDAYTGAEFAITTALSCQPGVVRVRSIADVLAEFLAHGEVKSATANGDPAGARARGLLARRHVTPSELRLISGRIERAGGCGRGLNRRLGQHLEHVRRPHEVPNAPPLELLMAGSAEAIAKRVERPTGTTVRAWRRRERLQSLASDARK